MRALLAVLMLAGCTPNEATVSGKVTLDGAPLAKGNIAFYGGEKAALAMGSKTFSVTLNSGTWTVTAADVTDGTKTANTSTAITLP